MNILLYRMDAPGLLHVKTFLIRSQIQNKYEVLWFLIDQLKYYHLLLVFKA